MVTLSVLCKTLNYIHLCVHLEMQNKRFSRCRLGLEQAKSKPHHRFWEKQSQTSVVNSGFSGVHCQGRLMGSSESRGLSSWNYLTITARLLKYSGFASSEPSLIFLACSTGDLWGALKILFIPHSTLPVVELGCHTCVSPAWFSPEQVHS